MPANMYHWISSQAFELALNAYRLAALPALIEAREQDQPIGNHAELFVQPIDGTAEFEENSHLVRSPGAQIGFLLIPKPVWRICRPWPIPASLIRSEPAASMESWLTRGQPGVFRSATLVE